MFKSLKYRLFIPLLIIFLSLFLIIGFFINENINKKAELFIKEHIKKISLYTLKNLDAKIEEEKKFIKTLSNDPDIIDILKNPNQDRLYKKIENYFKTLHKHFKYYENIVLIIKLPKNKTIKKVIDNREFIIKDATALIDSVDRKTVGKGGYKLKFIKKALIEGKFHISKPYPSILRKYPIFVIINPVKVDKKIIGAVVIAPKLWEFGKDLITKNIGKKGYTFIIDDKGKILIHKNFDYIFKKNIKDILPIDDKFLSKNITKKIKVDSNEIFIDIKREKKTNWKVVSIAYKDDFIEPFLEKKYQILLTTLFVLLSIFLLLNLILKKYVISPLEELSNIVKKYKIGKEIEKNIDLENSPLEIKNLYDSFINLSKILNKNHYILKKSKSFLNDIINASLNPIYFKNKKHIFLGCNRAFEKFIGVECLKIKGKKDIDIFDKENRDFFEKMEDFVIKTEEVKIVKKWFNINGKKYYLNIVFSPLKEKDGEVYGVATIINDLTDLKKAQEKVIYQAMYDSLTNLPNRNLLYDRLEHGIFEAKREDKRLAILFLDLDHFKNINDSLGHDIGDKLLIEVANRLKKNVRRNDTVSRIGGDEFIILLENPKSHLDIMKKAKEILKEISKPYKINSHELLISGSIGVSIFPDDGETKEELIKNADIAMYHAKELGRNNIQFFSKRLSQKVQKEYEIEKSINSAIKNSEFELYYQPQLDIKSNKIVAAEALIRWNHPKYGIIYPDRFIHLAENTGLIIPIGRWVVKEASYMAKKLNALGYNIKVSINVSIRQFQHDNIIKILKEQNIDPKTLEIEITENIAMYDIKKHLNSMKEIKSLGFDITMDDFGTGYSSLNYLKKFPINKVKIDKSFILDMDLDKKDRSIVKAIVTLSKGLDLKVVAEGVEKKEHLDFLREIGCDFYQGYYFSKPIKEEDFIKLLKENYEDNLS